jgi:hypothetical protein
VLKIGPGHESLPKQRELIGNMAMFNSLEIADHFPEGLAKRWPGYALDRAVREPENLIQILAGSEGTLAAIISAELKLVPTPDEIGLGLIFFDSIADAMQATTELLDLKPAAVEHIDRVLLDQTRGQREFAAARDLLELDATQSLLAEFYATSKTGTDEKKTLGRRKIRKPRRDPPFKLCVKPDFLHRWGAAEACDCIEDASLPQGFAGLLAGVIIIPRVAGVVMTRCVRTVVCARARSALVMT